ncbi:MAG: phosphohistidine phosphatase SixA [Proteobacteria bacterium]|nr:phosphohistidine phosphatase SixA [Pseudomonadota bacterium]
MELILWRHAEAEDGFPDGARQLTGKGLDQARRMADWLKPKLPENTRIIVSPARRAQQTAMALESDFVTESALAPGASAHAVLAVAGWPVAGGVVVIVGHQPTLGEIAGCLIPVIPAGLQVKKGSVWWIRNEEKDGVIEPKLHTVIYPEML